MKANFLTKFAAGLAALSMVTVHTPAQASPGCTGCNVRDEGVFHSGLVGQTVYVAGSAYTVTGLDVSGGTIYLQDSAGQPKWSYANQTYTTGAQQERNAITAVGIGVGLLAILAAAASSQSSNTSSSYKESRLTGEDDYLRQKPWSTYTPSSSVPAPPINSFYGSCHGGSFYGCK